MTDLTAQAQVLHLKRAIAEECRQTAALGPAWAVQIRAVENPAFAFDVLAKGFATSFTLEFRRFEVVEDKTTYLLSGWATYGPWPEGYRG